MRTGWLFCAAASWLLAACSVPAVKVGLLSGGAAPEQIRALDSTLAYFDTKVVNLSQAAEAGCDVLWYHRSDTSAVSPEEIAAGDAIKRYVGNGGHLILSMDAVRLLNVWGIESQPVENWSYDCVDDGFGRKIGIRGYMDHPVYDALFGGAYTWHGEHDNTVRMNGFTGGNLPKADGAKVIGCQWEYIFNRPELKLMWVTPYGKGSILAIGGCLYYGQPNFHKAILDRFTNNCVSWISGNYKGGVKENHWDYTPAEVVEVHKNHEDCSTCSAHYKHVSFPAPKRHTAGGQAVSLLREASGNYFDLASPRQMLVAYESAGIDEIWAHPFMALRDYSVMLDIPGKERIVSLGEYRPIFEITPSCAIRRYNIDGIILSETISVSPTAPVTTVHYEWEGGEIRHLLTSYKSNLRLMWPYDYNALGSLYYQWADELNGFVVRDSTGAHAVIVGGNQLTAFNINGQYDGFGAEGCRIIPRETRSLIASNIVSYETLGGDALDVVIAAGNLADGSLMENYAAALKSPESVKVASERYYADYFKDKFRFKGPDPEFNEAFLWAQISAMQFKVDNPKGLLAGYSSSRRGWGGGQAVSGRPGYAWHFGRDAVWAAYAFADMGDFETVRDVLDVLSDHQEIDGKIYHELTTSGFAHFDASDATPLYVTLMARYLRASGDVAFVKRHMESIHKAMDYCYSTDTDGDGLIENVHVGHGWLEGGALFGSQAEFYLCGIWAKALEDAAWLSNMTRMRNSARDYAADAVSVKGSLENFWNEKGYYNYGLMADDTYTEPLVVLAAVPAYLQMTDPVRSAVMGQKLAVPEITADWGARSISSEAQLGEWGAYGPRHIWPLFTGWVSMVEYLYGMPMQGFATFAGSLMNYKSFSLGRIPEVINSDIYRNNGITQHQCWSETMAILPLIEGMLGFRPDATSGSVRLAPCPPADWLSLEAENLRVGDKTLSVRMTKTPGQKVVYSFESNGKIKVFFDAVALPGGKIKSIKYNGKEVFGHFVLNRTGTLELEYDSEGCSVVAPVIQAKLGEAPSGYRLLEQSWDGKTLSAVLSGRKDSVHRLKLYAPSGIESTSGCEIISSEGPVTTVEVAFSNCTEGEYARKIVTFSPANR